MHKEGGDFGVGEAEGVKHDGPVHTVGGDEDVLADDMGGGGPETAKGGEWASGLSQVTGEGEIIDEGVEPDVGDVLGVKGQLDAPGEPGFGAGNTEVARQSFDGIAQLRETEGGDDEVFVGIDELQEPFPVLGEFEVPVFLLQFDDLSPFGAEFARFIAFLIGQELFLADAVEAFVSLFDELAFVVETLEDLLHNALMRWCGRGSPSVEVDLKFLPKLEEFGGATVCEFLGRHPFFFGGLLDLLPVLIHAGQKKNGATTEFFEPGENIGEDFFVGVADVGRRVGVVDGRGIKGAVRHRAGDQQKR